MDKQAAFLAAIHEHQALVFKVAAIYTNTTEDRNDLRQEIIFQLWKSFDGFRQQSSLTTWMYQVAMNTAIWYLKTDKRKIKTAPINELFIDFPDDHNPELEERWQLLKTHIDQLNLLDKGIVMLYLDNKSYDEIAQIIGISTSNVGTKLGRIKEKLRTQISKQL